VAHSCAEKDAVYLRFFFFRLVDGSSNHGTILLASPAEVRHGLANSDIGLKLQPVFAK